MRKKFHAESVFCKCGTEIKLYDPYWVSDEYDGDPIYFCSPECFAEYFGTSSTWTGYYTDCNDDDEFDDDHDEEED